MNSQIRAWAQLVRVPNTLTSCADVLAGLALVVGASNSNSKLIVPLLVVSLASVCFYWAGMVLNDVHDLEKDKLQRRNGPIVDGRISIHTARLTGWGLLIGGWCLALLSRTLVPDSLLDVADAAHFTWMIVPISTALAVGIVAYDSRLKATQLGPWLMGLCRGLNMTLGVSLGTAVLWPSAQAWACILSVVLGHVLFVVGITLAARREGLTQQSWIRMIAAWSTSLLGVAAIATSSVWSSDLFWSPGTEFRLDPRTLFPALVFLLALPWLRRAVLSATIPGVETLVPAIKQAILTIIFFDAAVALQYGGNVPGLIVCSFAIPTLALARIFRMT